MVGRPGACSHSPMTQGGLPSTVACRTCSSPAASMSAATAPALAWTSPSCAGSALMLGMRTNASSSARATATSARAAATAAATCGGVSVTTRSVTKTYDPPVARVAERTHRRVLPGVLFPVAVFVVWRLAQLAVTRLAHGDLVDTAFPWDGNAYRRILEHGYHIAPNEFRPVTAFFPGIAWVAKGPDLLVDHTTAMVLTANVVALLAFVAVWAVAREWRDERLARASVVLLALWPGTLFYWAFYSEALLVASTAGAVWFDRRGHRWPAALLLYVAALSRSVGIS